MPVHLFSDGDFFDLGQQHLGDALLLETFGNPQIDDLGEVQTLEWRIIGLPQ
jgi:hypothetical protein